MRLSQFAAASLVLALRMSAQSDLPNAPGKEVVQRMCTTCHTLGVVTGQRMTKDHWATQVDDMVSRGAKGTSEEIALVVDYLARYFGKSVPSQSNEATPQVTGGEAALAKGTPRNRPAAQERSTQEAMPKGNFVPHADPAKAPGGVTYQRILNAEKEPQNWLTYGGTYRSTHHTLLNQITPANVKHLELKWVFQAHWLDPYETTPLVVEGVLYTTQGNDVVALDAATGRLFWIYRYTPVADARLCCGRITRGLAIYGDTLYLAAVDAHLIALDAKTGNALWDTTVAKTTSGYSMTGAPMIVKDKVLVGVAGGEYGDRHMLLACI